MGFIFIAGCILFTVYGQLVLKWRMGIHGMPEGSLAEKAFGLVKIILLDPFVFSGFCAAFIASLFWMAAMTKFSLSFAYPFMSLAFVLVMLGSFLLFNESINLYKVAGTLIIVSGLVVLSKGY